MTTPMTPPQPTVDELKQGFTPGPWVVRNGCNVFADAEHVPLTGLACIAVTGGMSGQDTIDRDAANAHLIAAAPDLYAALEALLIETVDYATINNLGDPEKKHNVKLARAALAKARGEGK